MQQRRTNYHNYFPTRYDYTRVHISYSVSGTLSELNRLHYSLISTQLKVNGKDDESHYTHDTSPAQVLQSSWTVQRHTTIHNIQCNTIMLFWTRDARHHELLQCYRDSRSNLRSVAACQRWYPADQTPRHLTPHHHLSFLNLRKCTVMFTSKRHTRKMHECTASSTSKITPALDGKLQKQEKTCTTPRHTTPHAHKYQQQQSSNDSQWTAKKYNHS